MRAGTFLGGHVDHSAAKASRNQYMIVCACRDCAQQAPGGRVFSASEFASHGGERTAPARRPAARARAGPYSPLGLRTPLNPATRLAAPCRVAGRGDSKKWRFSVFAAEPGHEAMRLGRWLHAKAT
jgi:hypothetical protein